MFIDGYQSQPGRDREAQLEQVKLRGRHCTGVIVNHVAQAMFAGQLSPEEEAVLQRSAEYDTGRRPDHRRGMPPLGPPGGADAADG